MDMHVYIADRFYRLCMHGCVYTVRVENFVAALYCMSGNLAFLPVFALFRTFRRY